MRTALLLRLALAAGSLALVWSALDGGEALARLRGLQPGWAAAALIALSVQTWLAAWRWWLTARQLGVPVGPRRALSEYYLAQLVNQIMPGGMVGDVGRALRNADGGGRMRAGQAVVLERLMGNAMLMAVMMAAMLAGLLMPARQPLPGWLLLMIAGAAALVLLLGLLIRLPHGQGRIADLARSLRGAIRTGLLSPEVLRAQILLSLGTVLANLAAFAFAARATGTDLPLIASLILVPLILFTMLIPLSISGWGLREGAAAALFPLAGFSGAAGLAASVAFGLIFLLASLPGLVVLLVASAGNAGRARMVEKEQPDAR